MRDIKFRLFDSQTKEMLYKISDHWTYWEDGNTLSGNQDYLVLEQYTGIKDKNGKEIYEGDIIKVHDKYSDVWSTNGAEVIFSIDYVGGWVISNGKENLTLGKRQNSLRIIGNIHENPELLES